MPVNLVLQNYGRNAGGWTSFDTFPRVLGDVNGDGRADIVGFGEAGVYVSLGQRNGTYGQPNLVLQNFAHGAGGWTSFNTFPRAVGDVNGDGRADIVGFGDAGVYVSLGQRNGSFGQPNLVLQNFGHNAGGWTSFDTFPRVLGDVNGDGRADIVGFGDAGTYVSLGQRNGTFAQPNLVLQNFGRNAGGWTSFNTFPRAVGDVNGDGRADVVGFGEAGTYVALGQRDGSLAQPNLVLQNFAHGAGGWTSQDLFPRTVGDVNNDGRADIVGFGEAGTYVALGQRNGTFAQPRLVLQNFAHGAGGWTSFNTFPRAVGDVNGNGRDDLVGFGDAGVYVALSRPPLTFG
ncbi:VCBS repeat-containing protein [Rhodovastum atsumiense]|nr:VCBS repeat-containing protein [Rhodovastum atsumiense]CAH2603213.1 VCBS repeat-containing protein [Rhodovastum atsumiense]